MSNNEKLVINGWTIYAHPLFLEQLENYCDRVNLLKSKNPDTWQKKNVTKVRDAIILQALVKIPEDPSRKSYRQGNTLGKTYKSWFRAKFFQQYRLYFRYNITYKIIIYGWVNDDQTLRSYGSKTDAYEVFKRMLDAGNPPTDWKSLMKECVKSEKNLNDIIYD